MTIAYCASDEACKIIPSHVTLSKNVYTLLLSMEGDIKQEDQIIIDYCSKDEEHLIKKVYQCKSMLALDFTNVEPSDYVRIYWKDVKQNQRCEPLIVHFNVIYTLDLMDLTKAISMMNHNYEGKVELITNDPIYVNGRLIAKIQGELPDISMYRPEMIVIDDENHYYIQFLQDKDAMDCEQFLMNLDEVIYVEPDSLVNAVDTSEQENGVSY